MAALPSSQILKNLQDPQYLLGRYFALTDYLAKPNKMNVLEKAEALVILASEPMASE